MFDSCDPVDCSPPDSGALSGSSVHEILQVRILEWVAVSFSRGSSQPRGWTWVTCTAGRLLTNWATRELSLSILLALYEENPASVLTDPFCISLFSISLNICSTLYNFLSYNVKRQGKNRNCWVEHLVSQLSFFISAVYLISLKNCFCSNMQVLTQWFGYSF